MSLEYTAKFGVAKAFSLKAIVENWNRKIPYDVLSKCTDDEENFMFFAKGSIRGCRVYTELKNELTVKLNIYASQKDAEIAYMFLDFISNEYSAKIFGENGELKAGITPEEIMAESSVISGLDFLGAMLSREDHMVLPQWDVPLFVYKSKYEEMKRSGNFPDNFNQYIQEKALKLFQARRAKQIQIPDGRLISTWSFDDTIVLPCDLIVVGTDVESEDYLFVKWDDFIRSEFVSYEVIPLGKDAGDCYFISELDDSLFDQAFEYFDKHRVPIDLT